MYLSFDFVYVVYSVQIVHIVYYIYIYIYLRTGLEGREGASEVGGRYLTKKLP